MKLWFKVALGCALVGLVALGMVGCEDDDDDEAAVTGTTEAVEDEESGTGSVNVNVYRGN
ncbi:MAG: hypothetical protein R6V03_04715 [Kiritimatiellia bacterium]